MPIETQLYDILKIDIDADFEQIKKGFRKQALIYHPDRGGDEETFKKIQNAYEILSDPKKKEIYDKNGIDGINNQNNQNHMNFFSRVDQIFQDYQGRVFENPFRFVSQKKVGRKTQSTQYEYKVSLENLYQKKTINLEVSRDRICKCCENFQKCESCNGRGSKPIISQFGPFVHQMNMSCYNCKNTGKKYEFCKKCNQGIINDIKIFNFELSPDMQNGYKYIFPEQGNQYLDSEPGDFILIIIYEKHPIFEIRNNNLIYNKIISLKESLCGHKMEIEHPSGEILKIKIEDITKPNTIRIIDKGMTQNSKLEIHYQIIFPEKIDQKQKKILVDIL